MILYFIYLLDRKWKWICRSRIWHMDENMVRRKERDTREAKKRSGRVKQNGEKKYGKQRGENAKRKEKKVCVS